jgi:hypothetical protein
MFNPDRQQIEYLVADNHPKVPNSQKMQIQYYSNKTAD